MPTSQPRRRRLPLAVLLLLGATCTRPTAGPTEQAASSGRIKALLRLQEIEPKPRFPPAAEVVTPAPAAPAVQYLREGQSRFDQRQWAEAVTLLKKALEIDPQYVEAHILLARASLQQGDRALAKSHLSEALKRRPRDVAIHQLLGEIARQEGRTTDAIGSLRLALMASEDAPNRPERVLAHLSLALALRKEGYLRAAVDQLEAYLAAVAAPTPDMPRHAELAEIMVLFRGKAAGLVGEIQTQLRHYPEAVEAYRRAVAEAPEDVSFRSGLARALAHAGRAAEALETARGILADAPREPDALSLLGEVCELIGGPQRYDDELIRLAKATHDGTLRCKLVERLAQRGGVEEAIGILEDAAGMSGPRTRRIAGPGTTQPTGRPGLEIDGQYLLARLYLRHGSAADGLEVLAEALRAHPESYAQVDSLLAKADGQETLSGLVDHSRRLREREPNDVVYRYLHGRLLALAGHRGAAVAEFEAARRLDGSFGPAQAALADLFIREKRWRDAIAAAQAGIKAGLGNASLHLLEGRGHEALDEFGEAQAAFLEAFRLDRTSPLALFELAQSLERRRDQPTRCEQVYRQIIDEVDPTFIPAREKLVRLYLNTGRLDEARRYFEEFGRLKQTGPAVERCRALIDLAVSTAGSGQQRLEEYQATLRSVVARYPDDIGTYIDLAMSYFATGEYRQALEHTEQALHVDSTDLRARELKAKLKAKLLDFDAAADILARLLTERPRNTGWQQQLVELAFYRADYEAAISRLRVLLDREDLRDSRVLFVHQLIAALSAAERFDEAVDVAKDWLDEAPDDPLRRDRYLATLDSADRHEEAVRAAARWLADDPTNASLRRQYIAQLQAAGRAVEAQQLVLSWLSRDPDDIDLNRLLLLLLWSEKQWDDAIEVARTGTELAGHRASYEQWLGRSYVLARRFDEAIEFCRRQARTQETELAYRELISVLIAAERFEQAELVVQKLLQPQLARQQAGRPYDPAFIAAMRRYLARIHQMAGRPHQAMQQLEAIYKMTPNEPGINNDLGYTWAEAGVNLDQAERMIRFAVGEQPRESAYLDSLGWILYKKRDFGQAAYYLRLAIKQSDTEDPVLYDHLGDTLYRHGEPDEAKANWERALDLSSPDADPPPTVEGRRLHEHIKAKLTQLAEDRPVDVAPVAEDNDQ